MALTLQEEGGRLLWQDNSLPPALLICVCQTLMCLMTWQAKWAVSSREGWQASPMRLCLSRTLLWCVAYLQSHVLADRLKGFWGLLSSLQAAICPALLGKEVVVES